MNQPGKFNAAAFKAVGRPFGVAPDSGYAKQQPKSINISQNTKGIGNSQISTGSSSAAAAGLLLSQPKRVKGAKNRRLPTQTGGKIKVSNQTSKLKSPEISPRSGPTIQQSSQQPRLAQGTQARSVQPGYQKQQVTASNSPPSQSSARMPQPSSPVASHNRPLSPTPASQRSHQHQPKETSTIAPSRTFLGQQKLSQDQPLPQYLQTAPTQAAQQQSTQDVSLQRVPSHPLLSSTKVKIVTLPKERHLKTAPASTAHLERVPTEDIPALIERNLDKNVNFHLETGQAPQQRETTVHTAAVDQQPIRPLQQALSTEGQRKVAIVRAVNKETPVPAVAESLYPVPDPDASPGLGRKALATMQPPSQPTFAFDSKVQVSTTIGVPRGRRNAGLDRTAVMSAGVHRVLGESN